jgi:hypothetical protein
MQAHRLHDREIAGKFVGNPLAQAQSGRQIGYHPCLEQRHVQSLARRRLPRGIACGRQIPDGAPRCFGRLEQHPEESRIDVDEAAVRVGIRCGDGALGARFVGEEACDEIIDGGQRTAVIRRNRIAQIVVHVHMIRRANDANCGKRRKKGLCHIFRMRRPLNCPPRAIYCVNDRTNSRRLRAL